MIVEALREYLQSHDPAHLQAIVDEEAERMNQADHKDPNYAVYLHGGEEAWER